MALTIPDFTRRGAPLADILEKSYAKVGRRTKQCIRGIRLQSLSWGEVHENYFLQLQDSLRNAVQLSYPKVRRVICVYTDASQWFWSGVVTQTDADQLQKPIEKQQHEPLAFLGSAFKGAERNWSNFDQEAYEIFQVFENFDYLFMEEQSFRGFTDHRNLLFVFAPHALEPVLGRHIASKIWRWTLFLSRFDSNIEHINGCRNVFSDILTRWTKGYRVGKLVTKAICSLQDTAMQVVPSAEDIGWPNMDELRVQTTVLKINQMD